MQKLLLLTLTVCALFFSVIGFIAAQSITLSATVPNTAISYSGYTCPACTVTFLEYNVVKGTTLAGGDGFFQKIFTAETVGVHEISVYNTDLDGNNSRTYTQNFVLLQYQTIEFSNYYFEPTLYVDKSILNDNELLTITGISVPGSTVQIEFSGVETLNSTVVVGNNGRFEKIFNFDLFQQGSHQVKAKVQLDPSINAPNSEEADFFVNEAIYEPPTASPTNKPTVIIKAVETVCPYTFKKLCLFEISIVDSIDSETELSAYLIGFIENYLSTTESRYDINNDGVVDEYDLSIVLYYTNIGKPYVGGITNFEVEGEEEGLIIGADNRTKVELLNFDTLLGKAVLVETAIALLTFLIAVIIIIKKRKNAAQK